MSRRSDKTRAPEVAAPNKQSGGRIACYVLVFVLGCAAATGFFGVREQWNPQTQATTPTPTARPSPSSHYDLLAMTPQELGKVDLALVNLLCAKGLHGAENLDIPTALKTFDQWAEKVRLETRRHLYRVTDPKHAEHYKHSEARLRAEFIVQVLQEDCGVHYDEKRINDPDFGDSRSTFIHGMLPGGPGGTCASMPVLYTVIGRRLGYPIKLVAAKEHLFCRWDDGEDHFNIDGACNGGVDYPPDEYYRTWPKPLTAADMASGEFLTSQSPAKELAGFLLHRGMCMHVNGQLVEARAAFAEAHRLQPRSANTYKALQVVCGAGRRPTYARQGPTVMPPDPADPTPEIPMPGANPTLEMTNRTADGGR